MAAVALASRVLRRGAHVIASSLDGWEGLKRIFEAKYARQHTEC
jgi:hypothetical protein